MKKKSINKDSQSTFAPGLIDDEKHLMISRQLDIQSDPGDPHNGSASLINDHLSSLSEKER